MFPPYLGPLQLLLFVIIKERKYEEKQEDNKNPIKLIFYFCFD